MHRNAAKRNIGSRAKGICCTAKPETLRDNEPRHELNGETEARGPIDAADPNPCRRA